MYFMSNQMQHRYEILQIGLQHVNRIMSNSTTNSQFGPYLIFNRFTNESFLRIWSEPHVKPFSWSTGLHSYLCTTGRTTLSVYS